MVYTQFISELSEHREPCCPVCRRSFPSESEVQEVVRVLQSKLHLVPEKLKITEQDLERTERRREEMVALRPVRYSVRDVCVKPTVQSVLISLLEIKTKNRLSIH